MYFITRGSRVEAIELVGIIRDELAQVEAKRLQPGCGRAHHGFSRLARQRGELLGLVLLRERVDELVEVAVHDRVDLVEREVDAVVGHAALREIVGADALAAIAAADQALAQRRLLLLRARGAAVSMQPRREHGHCRRAVAVLRAVVLAFDDDARSASA